MEELLPTFNRLREKHPSAQLRWFERGRLWESREAARAQGFGQGERRWEGPRAPRAAQSGGGGPARDRTWRPGGEHRDPRQKYKDAKKAKWDRYKKQIRARWEEKQQSRLVPDEGDFTPPHGDPLRDRDAGRARRFDQRGPGAPTRPHGDPMRPDRRPEWRGDRATAPAWRGREKDRRGWSDRRPPHAGGRDDERRDRRNDERARGGDRKPWGKAPGGYGKRKPFGRRRPAANTGTQGRRDDRAPGGQMKGDGGAGKRWGHKGSGNRRPPSGHRRPEGSRPSAPGRKKRREDDE